MVMHYEKDSVKENQFQALFPYMEIKLILFKLHLEYNNIEHKISQIV